ncbi:MAG: hypothetical protein ACM3U2_05445, partial [Deltaproteobacteria bacterium]
MRSKVPATADWPSGFSNSTVLGISLGSEADLIWEIVSFSRQQLASFPPFPLAGEGLGVGGWKTPGVTTKLILWNPLICVALLGRWWNHGFELAKEQP